MACGPENQNKELEEAKSSVELYVCRFVTTSDQFNITQSRLIRC